MSYSHSDLYITITPIEGTHKGQDFIPLAVSKASFDPGGKSSYMKGLAVTPVAIATGSAEPKLSFDVSTAEEAWRANRHVDGIGGSRCLITCVYRRPGARTYTWKFIGTKLETGGGWESDESKGVDSKLEWKLTDAHLEGQSIYKKRSAQS